MREFIVKRLGPAYRRILQFEMVFPSRVKSILFLSTAISIYDLLFLFYFRPFEFCSSESIRFVSSIGYSIVTGLSLLLSFYILKRKFERFGLVKIGGLPLILSLSTILIFLAFVNWIYTTIIGPGIVKPYTFIEVLGFVLVIAVFPIIIMTFESKFLIYKGIGNVGRLFINRSKQEVSYTSREYRSIIHLQPDRGNDSIYFKAEEFLCALSDENYSKIFLLVDGQMKKVYIRVSLLSVEAQLRNYSMVRCHKTAIINPMHIQRIQGNSKSRYVTLNHLDHITIPVSRKFTIQEAVPRMKLVR